MAHSILIVDDNPGIRRLLRSYLETKPDYEVCGEAENGKAAVKQFRELKPDLVLLDLGMPDIDGLEVGRQMHSVDPSVPLILFTLSDPWSLEGAARSAGICRVVSKSESWRLMDAIEEIMSESATSRTNGKSKTSSGRAKPRATAS